jgi:DNA-binding MarR family transcriptional regulator
LARLNEPEGVSQRHLQDELGLTSGTVSVRIDRLVEQGLVSRRPDPRDRRNTCITLTQRGRALFERVAPAHLENERHLLSSLTSAETELLATLLRKLLIEFEGSHITDDATVRLGLTLAPAHVSVAMRRAVGLPPVAGLLVLAVVDDSPAAAAGVEQGDVLLRAGRRDLRSIAALYATLAEVSAGHALRLTIRRGLSEHSLRLMLPATPTCLTGVGARTHHRATKAQHTV